MSKQVGALRKHLEQLFPGKWLQPGSAPATPRSILPIGLPEFERSIVRGIARRRITEWLGPISSGKTSLLRSAIANWCASGANVAYIDAQGRLLAADWAFVSATNSDHTSNARGKFWIVRPSEQQQKATNANQQKVIPLASKSGLQLQEALWSAGELIASNAFDVVVLDLGSTRLSKVSPGRSAHQKTHNRNGQDVPHKINNLAEVDLSGTSYQPVPSRVYARLQRQLDRSKTALIVVRDLPAGKSTELPSGWGCHARFNFDWSTGVRCEAGLAGLVMITPVIRCAVSKDGISQEVEVNLGCSVQNRLFAHPQVPDRRTSKG